MSENKGSLTVNWTVVVFVSLPRVPVTVNTYTPVGVVVEVDTLRFTVDPMFPASEARATVAPAGTVPETLSSTSPTRLNAVFSETELIKIGNVVDSPPRTVCGELPVSEKVSTGGVTVRTAKTDLLFPFCVPVTWIL